MGFFISLALLTLLAGIALAFIIGGLFTRVYRDETGMHRVAVRSGPAMGVVAVWMLLTVGATVISSYQQVEAGEIGIVRSFGEISGQIEEGPNFIAPWKSSQGFNIKVQKSEFREPQSDADGKISAEEKRALGRIEAASIETQDVFLDITLNWQVSPNAVQDLVRNVGPTFFDVLVPTRVRQHAKAEVVLYTAVEVTQKREEIRQNIAVSLQADLNQFSITVVSLQIDNISYRRTFSDAIEEKQVATQKALAAEEIVAQRQAEARQDVAAAIGQADAAIETARGEAERLRVEAAGEADAIRLRADATAFANTVIGASLTADLIQFEALNHLGDVEIALLPADGSFLLDPSGILRRR